MVASLADVVSLLDATSVLLFAVTLVVFAIPVFIIFPPLPVERSDALGQTHSKIGVPPQESRLRDQWTMPPFSANGQAKAQQPANGRSGEPPAAESGAQRPRIHSLHIYPLKSCSGIELSEASVVPKGMEHDRVFCLAQRKTKRVAAGDAAAAAAATNAAEKGNVEYWDVVTLRQIALMANIKVDLWIPDATKHSRQLGPMAAAANNDEDGGSDEGSNGFLVVRFPWRDAGLKGLVQTIAAKLSRGLSASVEREFMLPMSFPDARDIEAGGYSHGEVTLFRNAISALNMSPELPPELARYLGLEPDKLALFRMDPARRRQVLRCAPTRDVAGYEPQVDFQDAVSGQNLLFARWAAVLQPRPIPLQSLSLLPCFKYTSVYVHLIGDRPSWAYVHTLVRISHFGPT